MATYKVSKSDPIISNGFRIKISGVLICLIWVLSTPFLLPSPSFSQTAKERLKKSDQKEPVEITAERMRSENGGQKIVFSGNVISYWDDLKITSDILEIYNSEDKKETDEIVAIGNVFITRGEKRARGDRAVYLDKLQKIILTGSPKATAWEGQDIIEGREMIFLLEADRFIVNERVRMMLYPKEKEKEKKKPKRGIKKKLWVDAKK